jgi:flagellar motor protein MotB
LGPTCGFGYSETVTKRLPQRTSKALKKSGGSVEVDEASVEAPLDQGWDADTPNAPANAPGRNTIPVQAEWLESDDEAPTRRRSSRPSPAQKRPPRPSPKPRIQKTPPPLPAAVTDHVGDAQRALQRLLALHPARDGEKLLEELQRKLKKVIDAGHTKATMSLGHVVIKVSASALFSSGDASMKPAGARALAEIAAALSSSGGMAGERIQVSAQARETGPTEWGLCAARAMAAAERLAASGVPANTISLAVFGALNAPALVDRSAVEITVLHGDAPSTVLVDNR